jgi:flagellar biosynthesis protein FlhB
MSGDKDQKTQDPTDKKLSDARAKGDVATATEVRHAIMFVAALVVAGGMGSWTLAQAGPMLVQLWGNADDYRLEPDGAQSLATGILFHLARTLAPILAVLFASALSILFVQGRRCRGRAWRPNSRNCRPSPGSAASSASGRWSSFSRRSPNARSSS